MRFVVGRLGRSAFLIVGAVFLSIAAGKTIGYFAGHLGAGAKIVRAMPNTPAAVIGRMSTMRWPM